MKKKSRVEPCFMCEGTGQQLKDNGEPGLCFLCGGNTVITTLDEYGFYGENNPPLPMSNPGDKMYD